MAGWMMNGNVKPVTRCDAHCAVWHVFTGQPDENDPNLLRAIAEWAEGMLRNKERHYPDQDRRVMTATLEAGVP